MHRTGERGEGKVGLLIAIAVVAVGIFLGMKFIPVRVAAYELRDFVEEECRFAAVRKGDDEVRKRIMNKAEELDIPLEPKNLVLRRTRSEMIITASYTKDIDLKVPTYVYEFDIEERAPLF